MGLAKKIKMSRDGSAAVIQDGKTGRAEQVVVDGRRYDVRRTARRDQA
jgi:hypothetical protein